jgi:hypothetical protein
MNGKSPALIDRAVVPVVVVSVAAAKVAVMSVWEVAVMSVGQVAVMNVGEVRAAAARAAVAPDMLAVCMRRSRWDAIQDQQSPA